MMMLKQTKGEPQPERRKGTWKETTVEKRETHLPFFFFFTLRQVVFYYQEDVTGKFHIRNS